jgi:pyrrolidone-carboxylate peptidase
MSRKRSSNEGEDPECRFVVTGFGPFQNVPINPTSVIADGLMEYLEQLRIDDPTTMSSMAMNTTSTVLEVSTVAVKGFLDSLKGPQEMEGCNGFTVLLHLGVHYCGQGFQLETCAYNDATFRIPDERGFQPEKELICESIPWEQAFYTPLDVNDLCQRLQSMYPGSYTPVHDDGVDPKSDDKASGKESSKEELTSRCEKNLADEKNEQGLVESQKQSFEMAITTNTPGIRIFPSSDPGRFVCNYTYCYSLSKFCQTTVDVINQDDPSRVPKPNHKFACLFLHVPPITVIPQDEQLKFVVELMKAIRHQLLSRKR